MSAAVLGLWLGVTQPAAAQAAPSPPAAPQTAPAQAAPAAAPPAEDIRDIRGPRGELPVWVIPAVLGGVLVLGLGGYALWRWLRRPKPTRVLLPSEIALQRLEEIRTFMRPDGVREFSVAVSDIVRTYIEARFKVTAARRTTEEFLHDLLTAQDQALMQHRGLLEEFLHQCDLAKFADMALSTQSMESLHRSARAFVMETAAPAAPVHAAPAAAAA